MIFNRKNSSIFVSPHYPNIKFNLNDFELDFDECQNILQKSRNTIKQLKINNISTVVKSFRIPDGINDFIYRYFRMSKSRRSFEYAEYLRYLNILTPRPIAYIEVFSKMRLYQSYYITEYYAYDFSIRELINMNLNDRDKILRLFVQFTYDMHQKGILHLDNSPGNTLIRRKGNGLEFCVVDINRLKIGNVSLELGISNFNRISTDHEIVEVIADEYAKLTKSNQKDCLTTLWKHIKKYRAYSERKERIKKIIK
ncbi:TPA: lipopolysaccharide kinase InaA family protein [Legionella pneumophila]